MHGYRSMRHAFSIVVWGSVAMENPTVSPTNPRKLYAQTLKVCSLRRLDIERGINIQLMVKYIARFTVLTSRSPTNFEYLQNTEMLTLRVRP